MVTNILENIKAIDTLIKEASFTSTEPFRLDKNDGIIHNCLDKELSEINEKLEYLCFSFNRLLKKIETEDHEFYIDYFNYRLGTHFCNKNIAYFNSNLHICDFFLIYSSK